MYDPEHSTLISEAFLRMQHDARAAGPYLGERIISWIQSVYKTERPEEAFINPGSFPLFLLPWYAETSLNPEPDKNFQSDLVYSTASGYYYIRFMDNLMDGHGAETLLDLPILNFFSTNFHTPYYKHFTNDHAFWEYFRSVWLRSAEVNILDAQLADIDKDKFMEVSAQKTCAVKIPVAAVFFHYGYPERIKLWEQFIYTFGCWHQMWDDIMDFPKDDRDGNRTYFLSEAQRRKRPDEIIVDWVIREGHDWGMEILNAWMVEMEELVSELNNPNLKKYINQRKLAFFEQKKEADDYLKHLEEILTSLKGRLEQFENK
jgi:hypothetical protein